MTQEQGRSVLVTGGNNRGIGQKNARVFARRGDRVAAACRTTTPPPGEALLCVPGDVTSAVGIDNAFKAVEEAHASVEALVANAGVTDDQLRVHTSQESVTFVLDTNRTGAWRMAKRAITGMTRAKQDRIILISSAAGMRGEANQANYAASTADRVGLARPLGP